MNTNRTVLFFTSVVVFSAICTFVQAATPANHEVKTYNAGLRIIDFEYIHPHGEKEVLTTAIWFPALEEETTISYMSSKRQSNESKVARDAKPSPTVNAFPVVLYASGLYASGYSSAFFCEHIARHGYVVVAPDYNDTMPPDYEKQIAWSRIRGGNTFNRVVLAGMKCKQFADDMGTDRKKCLSYLEERRLKQTRFMLEKIEELNSSPDSFLRGMLNENEIGICGHSLGGLTSLGVIGAHPGGNYEDSRIKAALLLSPTVYPFEFTLRYIKAPFMLMFGEHDPPSLGPEDVSRQLIYDRARVPKFLCILKDGEHLDFTNKVCGRIPLYRGVETKTKAEAICRYGLAFLQKYLKGDTSADRVLSRTHPGWIQYMSDEETSVLTQEGVPERPEEEDDPSTESFEEEAVPPPGGRFRDMDGIAGSDMGMFTAFRGDSEITRSASESLSTRGSEDDLAVKRDIPYLPDAGKNRHLLDLYLPRQLNDAPVLVFVHGGGWRNGTKDNVSYQNFAKNFAREGFVTVLPNYRLSDTANHPDQINDIAAAFAWIYNNINSYGGNNREIFISGHSAGGHLVSLLALDTRYLKGVNVPAEAIKGVLALSAVFDLPKMNPSSLKKMVEPAFGTNPEVWKEASPINHARSGAPPFLVLYAQMDPRTLRQQAKAFAKALREKNNRVETVLLKRQGHVSEMLGSRRGKNPIEPHMLEFLNSRSNK